MTNMTDPRDEYLGDDVNYVVIHGHRRAYRMKGSGPALLLLHGMACDSTTWAPVIDELAEHFTVIAPDLLGHGESDKPNADYSLGGFANGMRDLLTVLGIAQATVVGHSFGGGIAMQFAYQFPERTERIILVSTGGLGPEVTPLIRLITLPGAGLVTRAITAKPIRPIVASTFRSMSQLPLMVFRDFNEIADVYEKLADPAQTLAIQRLARTVLDWRGQFVTMRDRAYLTKLMPVMLIWGHDDLVLPVNHAQNLPMMSTSEVHIFEHAGHFPHKDHPEAFIKLVIDFCAEKAPAAYHRGRWRALMRRGDLPISFDEVAKKRTGSEGTAPTQAGTTSSSSAVS